jgi:transposase-like protein
MSTRYRCTACGNLTRFDVTTTRRTRAFWHYTVGGELSVEEEQVLDAIVESVVCRWCSASGAAIEEVRLPSSDPAGDA